MTVKKSFFTPFVCLIAFIVCLFPSLFTVKAESTDLASYSQKLDEGYAFVNSFILNENGIFTSGNVDGVLNASSDAVEAAEYLKREVSDLEYDSLYRNKHTDVLKVCKNAYIWKMENGYDPSIYAPTDGGITLVHNKLAEYKSEINNASKLVDVKVAYFAWTTFIESDEPALKVKTLSSKDGVGVKLEANDLIFAEDDVVEVTKFLNSVIIKNTQLAVAESDKLLSEDSGVAYFFSLRWKREGVILEGDKIPKTPITVTIELNDLGLENATDIQLVRYKGLGEIEFVEGVVVEDGYLTFTLETFGTDIESDYALDFAVVAKGYKQETKPIYVYVLIGGGVLILLLIIFQIIRGIKKRRRKKDYKKFVKQRKSERKNKTIEEL